MSETFLQVEFRENDELTSALSCLTVAVTTTRNVRRSVTAVACICILDLACERKSESSPKAWLIGENKARQAVRE